MRKYQATKGPALIANDLRRRLYEHFQWLSFSFHDRMGAGQLMARASTDVAALELALSPLPWSIQSAAMFLLGVVVLAFVQPMLAAAVAVVVGSGIAYGLWRARALYPASIALQEQLGVWSEFVEQQVQGIRVVKGHGFEPQFAEVGAGRAAAIEPAGIAFAWARAAFYAALLAGPGSAMLVVVGLGGWLGATGRMTPGDLLAFFQYVALLITPVIAGAELLSNWPQASAASARIAEVLATEPDVVERAHPRHLPGGPGTVRFERVSFGYTPERMLFDDLDLVVDGGSSIALVGASGAGKTTLAFLACRFYDPTSGRVFLDGVPVDELRIADLRGAVSIVFEDTVVFTDSIRENLRVGRPEATDEEIERAGATRRGRSLRACLAAGLRHGRRAPGLFPLRRSAAAPRHRARHPARLARAHPR